MTCVSRICLDRLGAKALFGHHLLEVILNLGNFHFRIILDKEQQNSWYGILNDSINHIDSQLRVIIRTMYSLTGFFIADVVSM